MQIPDGLVYALAPIGAAMAVWIGKQFVLSTSKATGERKSLGLGSARDFIDLRKALVEELNGRYMSAEEARREFLDLNNKIGGFDSKFDAKIGQLHSVLLLIVGNTKRVGS